MKKQKNVKEERLPKTSLRTNNLDLDMDNKKLLAKSNMSD